jgi:hypothetical protein
MGVHMNKKLLSMGLWATLMLTHVGTQVLAGCSKTDAVKKGDHGLPAKPDEALKCLSDASNSNYKAAFRATFCGAHLPNVDSLLTEMYAEKENFDEEYSHDFLVKVISAIESSGQETDILAEQENEKWNDYVEELLKKLNAPETEEAPSTAFKGMVAYMKEEKLTEDRFPKAVKDKMEALHSILGSTSKTGDRIRKAKATLNELKTLKVSDDHKKVHRLMSFIGTHKIRNGLGLLKKLHEMKLITVPGTDGFLKTIESCSK